MSINDYFDRDIDRVNRPNRPIPRGAVNPRGALAFSLVLFAIAVGERRALVVAAVALGLAALVSFRDPTTGQSRLKYGMFLAAAAFVVGRAALVV